jgi:basic amino acid/polyamine antiporter, APA family
MGDISRNNQQLARRLGLLAATMTGLGVIIGAGIYVIIGVAAGQAGNAVWLSFILAAVGASLTALSYARLSKLRSQNAPEYQFVSMAFGNRPAFFAGWLILLAQIISSAAVALGFAGYLNALSGFPELPAAIGLIVLSSLILYIGISQSTIIAIILTAIEIVGLTIIIGIGLPHIGEVNYLEMPLGISGVFTAASLVFFAYLGFEGMANLSEELKDPGKNLPKAILLALGISTIFYVLVSISTVSVVGWDTLVQSNAPLAIVAEQVLGNNAGVALSIISLASTANTVLVLLLAASRIMHAMARARVLPGILNSVSPDRQTPWLTILVGGLVSILLVLISNLQQIAEYTNFITLLAFIGVNASAVKLLVKESGIRASRHILLNRVVPILGIIVSIWLAINAGWQAALAGLVILLIGLLVYWLTNLTSKRRG